MQTPDFEIGQLVMCYNPTYRNMPSGHRTDRVQMGRVRRITVTEHGIIYSVKEWLTEDPDGRRIHPRVLASFREPEGQEREFCAAQLVPVTLQDTRRLQDLVEDLERATDRATDAVNVTLACGHESISREMEGESK